MSVAFSWEGRIIFDQQIAVSEATGGLISIRF